MPTGETYRRWAAGCCPCCGGELDHDVDGQAPAPIGEGVMICGRCVANDHMQPPGLVAAILAAIVMRTEAPIDQLLPGSWLPCSSGWTARPRRDTG